MSLRKHTAAREPIPINSNPQNIAIRWRARRDYRLARHLARLAEALLRQAEKK